MKRFLLLLAMTLLMLCLCSCPSSNTEKLNNEVVLSFVNQCNTAIYGLHVEYYIEDEAVGGQLVSVNSDMDTPFQKDQTINMYLIQKDFPENADLDNFGMLVLIVLENKSEAGVGNKISLPVEFGKNYQFLLIENNGNCSIERP